MKYNFKKTILHFFQIKNFISIFIIIGSIFLAGCVTEQNWNPDSDLNNTISKAGPVPNELSDNRTYQNYRDLLQSEGYIPASGKMTMNLTYTGISQEFFSNDGKNATLSARIINGLVEEVLLVKNDSFPVYWYIGIILLIILICVCIWAGYRYYLRKNTVLEKIPYVEIEPFDFVIETRRLLTEAENSFSSGYVKEAYALAGQALRIYISYLIGSGSAQTNQEVLLLIKRSDLPEEKIYEILNTSTMVEFAKQEGDAKEFSEIIAEIRKMIQSHSPDNNI